MEFGESDGVALLPDSLTPVSVHDVHGPVALVTLDVPGMGLVSTVGQHLVTILW